MGENMGQIDLGVSGSQVTVSPTQYPVSKNSLGSVTFHNASSSSVTVSFTNGSPFTETQHSIPGGGNWSPHWASNATVADYDYDVTSDNLTKGTGDIDITSSPMP